MHNHTDLAEERAQNAGMASIILTQPRSLGASIEPGQPEGGRLTRFIREWLSVRVAEFTTSAQRTILGRDSGGGAPAEAGRDEVVSTHAAQRRDEDRAAQRSRTSDIGPGQRRKATHLTHDDAPVLAGISPLTPRTMPRAEDDEATRAASYEFHDRPGSGRHTADRLEHF